MRPSYSTLRGVSSLGALRSQFDLQPTTQATEGLTVHPAFGARHGVAQESVVWPMGCLIVLYMAGEERYTPGVSASVTERILAEAMTLPEADRRFLADALAESVMRDDENDAHGAWAQLALQRLRQHEEAPMETLGLDEAEDQLKRQLRTR
jgi:hypothetical protein